MAIKALISIFLSTCLQTFLRFPTLGYPSGSHLFPSGLDVGNKRLRHMITTPQVQLASLRHKREGSGEEKR